MNQGRQAQIQSKQTQPPCQKIASRLQNLDMSFCLCTVFSREKKESNSSLVMSIVFYY